MEARSRERLHMFMVHSMHGMAASQNTAQGGDVLINKSHSTLCSAHCPCVSEMFSPLPCMWTARMMCWVGYTTPSYTGRRSQGMGARAPVAGQAAVAGRQAQLQQLGQRGAGQQVPDARPAAVGDI